jgi:hypothetical protein
MFLLFVAVVAAEVVDAFVGNGCLLRLLLVRVMVEAASERTRDVHATCCGSCCGCECGCFFRLLLWLWMFVAASARQGKGRDGECSSLLLVVAAVGVDALVGCCCCCCGRLLML